LARVTKRSKVQVLLLSIFILFYFILVIRVCNLLIQVAVPVPQFYCLETKGSTGNGGENLTSNSTTQ